MLGANHAMEPGRISRDLACLAAWCCLRQAADIYYSNDTVWTYYVLNYPKCQNMVGNRE